MLDTVTIGVPAIEVDFMASGIATAANVDPATTSRPNRALW